jgi:hypothetical protein
MRPLTFGVYPGGVADADQGLLTGLPDDFERADAALIALQGPAKRFIVRCYSVFKILGARSGPLPALPRTPAATPNHPRDQWIWF